MPSITNNQMYLFAGLALFLLFIYAQSRAEGMASDYDVHETDNYYASPAPVSTGPVDLSGVQEVENGMFALPPPPLSADDLLPSSDFLEWQKLHPAGEKQLTDRNFLTAGHHIGINTTGQSLRNANYQIRSEPPNPQIAVSPWQQATIGPDINRRTLEVGENTVTAYKI